MHFRSCIHVGELLAGARKTKLKICLFPMLPPLPIRIDQFRPVGKEPFIDLEIVGVEKLNELLIHASCLGVGKTLIFVKYRSERPVQHFPKASNKTTGPMLTDE